MIPNVLTIAGSDPSGGAGIQADLKTFTTLGTYGMAAITALTAQNTQGVTAIHTPPPEFLEQQLIAIFEDIDVHAVKIGMIATAENAEIIASILKKYKPKHIILDPIMIATSGDQLITDEAITALKTNLTPLATLITPNIPEHKILGTFNVPTLLKGGHNTGETATDTLIQNGKETKFSAPRINTNNTHGTGCTLAAAITATLAKGRPLESAIQSAKTYLSNAIKHADALTVGKGHGPVNHIWNKNDE